MLKQKKGLKIKKKIGKAFFLTPEFEIWVEIGQGPEAFWRQTPRIFAKVVSARATAAQVEQDRMIWAAWNTAALQRAKKMPALDKLLAPRKPKAKRGKAKPWQQMLGAWEKTLSRK